MSTLLEKLIGSAALKDSICKCLRIKLKPGSVTTDKIADKAVTPAKLSDSVKTDLIQAPINAVQENLGDHVSDTTKHITAQERSTWNSKQDALTFDNLPTQGSNNPVKSGGILNAITNAISNLSTLFTAKKISFNSNNSSDTDTGYVEGFVKTIGSSRNPGVRIKTNSTYSEGSSEISIVGGVSPIATISAGEIHAYAGESASIFLTDPTITFDGSPATIDTNGISIIGSGYNADAPIEIKQTTGGEVDIISTEGNVLVQANTQATISASDVRVESENTGVVGSGEVTIFSGNSTTSPVTPGNISIETLTGPVAITGNPVTINGKDADWAVEKVDKMYDPSGMGRSDFNIKEEGIYFTNFTTDPLDGTGLHYYRPYLLLVGTEMRTISSGRETFLDQTLIRLDGRIYKRSIQLPSSGDIDWSTAPNFTEV
jgi:hypothetical protein